MIAPRFQAAPPEAAPGLPRPRAGTATAGAGRALDRASHPARYTGAQRLMVAAIASVQLAWIAFLLLLVWILL